LSLLHCLLGSRDQTRDIYRKTSAFGCGFSDAGQALFLRHERLARLAQTEHFGEREIDQDSTGCIRNFKAEERTVLAEHRHLRPNLAGGAERIEIGEIESREFCTRIVERKLFAVVEVKEIKRNRSPI
jgi:hypothetical protein